MGIGVRIHQRAFAAAAVGACLLQPALAQETCPFDTDAVYPTVGVCDYPAELRHSGLPRTNEVSNCTMQFMRLQILGDKVLFYDDTAAATATGMVFYIGRRVDITTDPLQPAYVHPAPVHNMVLRETVTTNLTQDSVTLQFDVDTYDIRSGEHLSNAGWRMLIEFPTCYSCKVTDYDRYNSGGKVKSLLTQQMCRIG